MLWALSGVAQTLHSNIMSRIEINFVFDFPATLSPRLLSHTYFLRLKTSVHPFYFIFSLWFFCKSCSALQQRSSEYSMTIFRKNKSTLYGSGFKIYHFRFSAAAEAVCTPTMATCVFVSSYYPMVKLNIPHQVSFNFGNSFHPTNIE